VLCLLFSSALAFPASQTHGLGRQARDPTTNPYTLTPTLIKTTKGDGNAVSQIWWYSSSTCSGQWGAASAYLSGYLSGASISAAGDRTFYAECRSNGAYVNPQASSDPTSDPGYSTDTYSFVSGTKSTACTAEGGSGSIVTCGTKAYSFKDSFAVGYYTVAKCPSKDIVGYANYYNALACAAGFPGAGPIPSVPDSTTNCKSVTTCYSSTDGSCSGSTTTCPTTTTTTTSATSCYNSADYSKIVTSGKGGCLSATSITGTCITTPPSTYYALCGKGLPGKVPNGNSGAQLKACLAVLFVGLLALW